MSNSSTVFFLFRDRDSLCTKTVVKEKMSEDEARNFARELLNKYKTKYHCAVKHQTTWQVRNFDG